MSQQGLINRSTVEGLAEEARRLSGTDAPVTPQEAVALLRSVTPGSGIQIDTTLTIPGAAADAKVTGDRLKTIESDLADLLYKAISITSLTNNVNTVEIGSTVTAVTFAWKFNKTPTAATFDGEAVANDSIGLTKSGLSITSNKSWTLTATDERAAVATKSTSVTFLNGVYYGVLKDGTEIASAAVLSLTRKLQSGKGMTFTANAGATQRIAFAIPSRYGTPTFIVGGFEGGFSKAATIDFTNASGYTERYDVWLSDNVNLGSTTVTVS